MYEINGTHISLTRGDTFITTVGLKNKQTKQSYTPVLGDSIRFVLKHNVLNVSMTAYIDKDPLIEKDIPIATMILQLDPEDTKELPFGKYVYDIEITLANGTVDTFINNAEFDLLPEVD